LLQPFEGSYHNEGRPDLLSKRMKSGFDTRLSFFSFGGVRLLH
jgi:hypothetical protein